MENEEDKQEGFKLSWFGAVFEVYGKLTVLIGLVLLLGIVLGIQAMSVMAQVNDMIQFRADVHDYIEKSKERDDKLLEQIIEFKTENAYLSTLSESEKRQLHLAEPPSLRERRLHLLP